MEINPKHLSAFFEYYGFTLNHKRAKTKGHTYLTDDSESSPHLLRLSDDSREVPYYRRMRGMLQIATTDEILAEVLNRANMAGKRNVARIVPIDEVYYEPGMSVPEVPKTSFYVALLGATVGEYIELPTGNPMKHTEVYHLVTEV